MGDGDGAVRAQQQLGHRLAHQVGAADHHGGLAAQVAQGVLQQHQAAGWSAGDQAREAAGQPPGVGHRQAVDVLVRVDLGDDGRLLKVIGYGELHEYAMDALVGVQPSDQVQQLGLGRIGGQPVADRAHADLLGLLFLAVDIDLAGRVLAHQHHGQARLNPVLALQLGHLFGDPAPEAFSERLPIDDPGFSHARPSPGVLCAGAG